MPNQHKVTEHRLGIARAALRNIVNYEGDEWEDDWAFIASLRSIAKSALDDMDKEVDKRRKRLEADQRKHIERVALDVKENVPA